MGNFRTEHLSHAGGNFLPTFYRSESMLTRRFIETPFGTKFEYVTDNDEPVYSAYLPVEALRKKRNVVLRLLSICPVAIGALAALWPTG